MHVRGRPHVRVYYVLIQCSVESEASLECSSVHLTGHQYAGEALVFSTLLPPVAMEPSGQHMNKYWNQRYRLFSKFDDGISMDNGKRTIDTHCY